MEWELAPLANEIELGSCIVWNVSFGERLTSKHGDSMTDSNGNSNGKARMAKMAAAGRKSK